MHCYIDHFVPPNTCYVSQFSKKANISSIFDNSVIIQISFLIWKKIVIQKHIFNLGIFQNWPLWVKCFICFVQSNPSATTSITSLVHLKSLDGETRVYSCWGSKTVQEIPTKINIHATRGLAEYAGLHLSYVFGPLPGHCTAVLVPAVDVWKNLPCSNFRIFFFESGRDLTKEINGVCLGW